MKESTWCTAAFAAVLGLFVFRAANAANSISFQMAGRQYLHRAYERAKRELGADAARPELFERMLKLDKNVKLVSEHEYSLLNIKVYKYEQRYRGVLIYDQSISVVMNDSGDVISVGGNKIIGLEKDVPSITPRISSTAAVQITEHDWSKVASSHVAKFEMTFTEKVIYVGKGGLAHLAYHIIFNCYGPRGEIQSEPQYTIDAVDGDILNKFDGVIAG